MSVCVWFVNNIKIIFHKPTQKIILHNNPTCSASVWFTRHTKYFAISGPAGIVYNRLGLYFSSDYIVLTTNWMLVYYIWRLQAMLETLISNSAPGFCKAKYSLHRHLWSPIFVTSGFKPCITPTTTSWQSIWGFSSHYFCWKIILIIMTRKLFN